MSSSITVHLPLFRLQMLSSSSLSLSRTTHNHPSPFGLISNTLHSAYLLPLQSHQLRCNLQSFAVFYFIRLLSFLFAIFDNKTSSLLQCISSPPLSHTNNAHRNDNLDFVIFCSISGMGWWSHSSLRLELQYEIVLIY